MFYLCIILWFPNLFQYNTHKFYVTTTFLIEKITMDLYIFIFN